MSNSVGGSDPVEGSTSKRRSRKRSKVWDHFDPTPDHKRALCKYCSKSLGAESKSGTTHLKRHLAICEKHLQGPQHVDQPLTMGIRDEVQNFGWTDEKARDVEVKKAILAEVPFAPSDYKKALSNLMGLMDIDKEICSYYEHEKEKLANEFQCLTSRVCFSYEMSVDLNYISITAHFINEDFNLVKQLIGFKKLPDNYSESCVARAIEKCISDWKLGDKIFSFTGSYYDSNYVSESLRECFPPKMLLEGLYFDVRCHRKALYNVYFDHIGPLCLKDNDNLIKAVEAVLCQMDTFNQIAKERGLPPINEDWLHSYVDCSYYLDIDDQEYGFEFELFRKAIPYKEVFSQYARTCLELENGGCNGLDNANLSSLCTSTELSTPLPYDIDWERVEDANLSSLCTSAQPSTSLCDIDWERVEDAVKIFDKVHEITGKMNQFSYPTSNLYFENVEEIEEINTNNNIMKEFNNKVYLVACVLDPRYKLIFMKYLFEKSNRPEFTKKEDINEIWEFLQTTFGAYVKENTNEFANLQEEGCTSNSTHLSCPIIDGFSMYTKQLEKNQKSELEEYLDDKLVDRHDASFNLLGWWKHNRLRYPVLSRIARDVLAVPTCAYSLDLKNDISLRFRALGGVTPQLMEAVFCSKDWILSDVQSFSESKH